MRKLIGFVLILSLLFVLTACRQDEPNKPVDLPQPDNLPKVVLEGDSYWTAVSWDISRPA